MSLKKKEDPEVRMKLDERFKPPDGGGDELRRIGGELRRIGGEEMRRAGGLEPNEKEVLRDDEPLNAFF